MAPLSRRATLAAALCLTTALTLPASAMAEDITVFAASSLKNALDAIAAQWQADTGNSVTISYAASPALAKQIEQGAPADLFLSASTAWMDKLQEETLINADSRRNLLGNTLVLVAHGNEAAPVDIVPGFDLAGLLGDGKLSMAMVDSVPAGQYGKAALISLGIWDTVAANVAQAENVRAALDLVVQGEAPLGVVYQSDAIADDEADNQVSVIGTFPADSHTPIVYPGAVVASSTKAGAAAFLDYLSTDAADAIFVGQGFSVLD